jgi:rod shape-determining protein MreD
MRSKNNAVMLYSAVTLSFVVAFALMIIPIEGNIKWLRPDFIALLVIFWATALPNHIGIIFAFMMGLMFDLLSGMLFGSMGLTLGIVAFLALNLRLRLRIYRYWQKFIIIMLLIGGSQLIKLWIQMLIGHPPASFTYWLTSISSALVWPLVYLILHSYQRTLRLA